jgi:hypothetical protein
MGDASHLHLATEPKDRPNKQLGRPRLVGRAVFDEDRSVLSGTAMFAPGVIYCIRGSTVFDERHFAVGTAH